MPILSTQSTSDDVPVYTNVSSYEVLRKALDDKLREYNETNAVMDLVLFQQAMEHITRIRSASPEHEDIHILNIAPPRV